MGSSTSSLSLGVKASSSHSAATATNNVSALLFHPVHGDNIRLSEGGRRACRVRSYCHGIIFTSRPVAVNEQVAVEVMQVSDQWSGVVRLGFTSVDPCTLTGCLPKYACPDLTSKPGFWAKAMSERFAEPGCVLFFYLTASGDVRLGMNGVERGVFLSGVDTSRPLWALFDVYGNATALQLVHERRRPSVSLEPGAVAAGAERGSGLEHGGRGAEVASDRSQRDWPRSDLEPAAPPEEPPDATLQPLLLHRLARGGDVSVSSCLTEASRLGPDSQPAYVLGASPLVPGGRLAVRLLAAGEPRAAGLAFGLTSCDPDTLLADELPADPDLLANRAEYWPLVADVVSWPMAGERLTFDLAADGVVRVQRGTGRPRTLMHVDASLTLWPVLGLTGGVGALRVLGLAAGAPVAPPQERAAATGGGDDAAAAAVTPQEPQSDCSVCLDRASDAALYACGHVCMCYTCAVQWRARGTGLCPVCCAPIRDVIRLYRS